MKNAAWYEKRGIVGPAKKTNNAAKYPSTETPQQAILRDIAAGRVDARGYDAAGNPIFLPPGHPELARNQTDPGMAQMGPTLTGH